MFAKAASDVALSVMVTWRYGAIGIVAGDCVVYLGLIAMAWFFCMPKGQWICKPSYAMAKRLIGTGLTISIAGLIVNTDILGDRLFLSWGSSKGEFACYAFHALLLAAGLTASSMIYQYQLPALLHAFGQHGNSEQIHRSTCRSFARVLVVGLAIAPIAVGTLGFVIHGWFPQYQFSIWLAVPLALSAVIEAANLFPLAVTTVGQHRGLLFGRLATAISGSILYGIALWSGARGEWYAAILLLTRMASLVICYVMSVRFCMLRRDEDGCSSLVAST